jgi:NAD(P)-dependent dehydrogenase (short-subunit alcohol dehydrogenase family)
METVKAFSCVGVGLGLGLLLSRQYWNKQNGVCELSKQVPAKKNSSPTQLYRNNVVLVTGGANGIGAGCVRAFHAQGATVWFCDIDTKAGIALAEELGDNRAYYRTCDVSNKKSVQDFIHEVTKTTKNQIHVLINNVGVQLDDGTPAHLLDEGIWSKVLAINLTSYFLFSKYCLPSLMSTANNTKKSTCIINMSSVQGLQSQPGIPAYAASKGGILSMTRQMSMDYAGKGVRVVAVNPGTIRTPLVENLLCGRHGKDYLPEALQKAGAAYPIGRIGEIDEIAQTAVFLASDGASFITGESVTVDGGIMAMGGWAATC